MKINTYTMPSASARLIKGYGYKYEPSKAHALHVAEDIYKELAELVRVECEYTDQQYPTVYVECEREGVTYTAEVEMSLYFKEYREMWGTCQYLHSMAPCWTTFGAYNECGDEIATDFDLSKFHKLLR